MPGYTKLLLKGLDAGKLWITFWWSEGLFFETNSEQGYFEPLKMSVYSSFFLCSYSVQYVSTHDVRFLVASRR